MVSGRYRWNDEQQQRIKDWVAKGNTLITIGGGTSYVIRNNWVEEALVEAAPDSTNAVERLPYVNAPENIGKERVGGIILNTDLDRTHPLGFGYQEAQIPVYKNNEVWMQPSQNAYGTVAKYAKNAHIDGFISKKNTEEFLQNAASLVVSTIGRGRVILFADNPNFRGSWYGTNRLFLNALFLGQHIRVPQ